MTGPRVAILNDTATRHHHGCTRVMANLVAGIAGAGMTVAARIPARADWPRDAAMRAALVAADLVVINGEGTLHDGAPLGARLLEVTEVRAGRPVALVNALWQDNPPGWNRYLPGLALVAARDSRSAVALAAAGARGVRWMPDLSLAAPAGVAPRPRAGLIVGDSVRMEARQALSRAAQHLGAEVMPTKTLAGRLWRLPPARAALWRVYTGTWRGPVPRFTLAPDAAAYLDRLAGAAGHVTGRFHGVCLSMLTETPFLALGSVTAKVEVLLSDAGLGRGRLISPDDLATLREVPPFSPAELAAIRAFRAQAAAEAARLFADLRGLA